MSIFMLSLAGLPPLAGFFGKFYLFSVALRADRGLLWLVIVALFGSFVSLYYYLIILKFVFVEKTPEPKASFTPSCFVANATIGVLAAIVLVFGLLPQTLVAQILAALP
jgi:NADH-quinone oxidoreductase subunit N